jgi:hypothetical protein
VKEIRGVEIICKKKNSENLKRNNLFLTLLDEEKEEVHRLRFLGVEL